MTRRLPAPPSVPQSRGRQCGASKRDDPAPHFAAALRFADVAVPPHVVDACDSALFRHVGSTLGGYVRVSAHPDCGVVAVHWHSLPLPGDRPTHANGNESALRSKR